VNYFVLIYDRRERKLQELREFDESDRAAAESFRHQSLRRSLKDHLDQDIVLFQAASREALQNTHGSYFLSPEELVARAREAAEAS
jgi:hypothetical protein